MSIKPKLVREPRSPDDNAAGFVLSTPDPLRYDIEPIMDPDEVPGILAKMIPSGVRLLDVGCGTGALGQVLSATCHAEVVGVEPDAARAARARVRGLSVRGGYLTDELIREIGFFDIVLLADVLEHLPNPHAMLRLVRKALKQRGAVIVSLPNVAHWSVRLDLLRGRFEYQECGIRDATHLRWFTAATARSLLASSGFKVTEYRAAANFRLSDNMVRRPLRWLSEKQRVRFLRLACRCWPNLFAVQHVLKGEMQ